MPAGPSILRLRPALEDLQAMYAAASATSQRDVRKSLVMVYPAPTMDPRSLHTTATASPVSPRTSRSRDKNNVPNLGPNDQTSWGQGAFLLKKTEISVSSTPAEPFDDDQSSDRASTCSTARDEKRGRTVFGRLGNRQGDEQSSIHSSIWRSSEDLAKPYDSTPFGTTVSIEAAQPVKACEQKLHEMRGLEQAASMKRWACEGKPAEAWGKLMKERTKGLQDPELWDHTGNTLVYFGYQRPQASFRIKASLLENSKSDFLISKLQEGFQRTAKLSPSRNNTSALRGGMRNLNLTAKGRQALPTLPENGNRGADNPIRHEIHFPASENASRIEILRHHITTRNLFAFLLDRPMIGLTYYQALTDLYERLAFYMPQEVDCAQLVVRYLIRNQLQNVSNDPAAAAGLLAWIESTQSRWLEGWREAFVHCVGMHKELRDLPEHRDIGHETRALLERSHVELQARIEACESRLSSFNFDDVYLATRMPSPLACRSYDRFRQFLRQFYERIHKDWPPAASHGGSNNWLTRELVHRLQEDFGSLYDYYVDRGRCWDKVVEPTVYENTGVNHPDHQDPLTRPLLAFDKKSKSIHIPYPYPRLPASSAELFENKPIKQSIFSTKSKTMEKRILHSCAEASNSLLVPAETASNGLVEAFLRFEKVDLISEANPREVRQGRWVLIYGILQVLATVSVDTPGLCFKDVPYFLNPRLGSKFVQQIDTEKGLEEANVTLSHCWTIPRTWKSDVSMV
ncbi:MAG: hypothetical protein Q9222_001562 [Ikaeria aurantiellina]